MENILNTLVGFVTSAFTGASKTPQEEQMQGPMPPGVAFDGVKGNAAQEVQNTVPTHSGGEQQPAPASEPKPVPTHEPDEVENPKPAHESAAVPGGFEEKYKAEPQSGRQL